MSWAARIKDVPSPLESSSELLDTVADTMPSLRSLSKYALSALGASQSVFANSNMFEAVSSCPNPQLSCHNTTVQPNLCCFNAPGGSLLQTQFWDTNPPTGPDDSWTIHGLWPDNCDGSYDANCDSRRAYTNITEILRAAGADETLSYMQTYWKDYQGDDESFWEHEWSKHGTCISTLNPSCYADYQPTQEVPDFFNRTVSLFQSLPSYTILADAGITPSSSKTYTSAQIQAALSAAHSDHEVYLGCSGSSLNEIWYFFNVRGTLQAGTFEPADPLASSKCPSTGIRYLPKGASSTPTGTKTSAAPTSTSTSAPGTPFSGKGHLTIIPSGSSSKRGCLISNGKWYVSGTCATYTASGSSDSFTLRSSKGACGVVDGAFTCGSGVSEGQAFSAEDGKLAYEGSAEFSADGTPSGTQQVVVSAGGEGSVGVQVGWEGA